MLRTSQAFQLYITPKKPFRLLLSWLQGKTERTVGAGNTFTDVENVTHTRLCVDRAITPEGSILGKTARWSYVISNAESIKSWISTDNEK
ncbi:hypothetical protein KIW84_040332 [Lathyrus oleraceus]|uniref:Uncharacterized protein n=1 Tax=Pisum sativum TaxID=3888 RepID=A0A9D4X8E8_PEA|nr:hypothetical protein KIW84_040332 [Pisum sativum]